MTTDISIASNALVLIGEDAIQSLDSDVAASNLYSRAYQGLLADHPWSFAMKEETLSRNSASPDQLTGYQYSYNLPSDLIRIWKLMPFGDYELVGNGLNSNDSSVRLRYVYKTSETNLPPSFIEALEYKLASEFAMSVTEDLSRAQWANQKYMAARSKARFIDSQGSPQVGIQHSPLSGSAMGGGRGYI